MTPDQKEQYDLEIERKSKELDIVLIIKGKRVDIDSQGLNGEVIEITVDGDLYYSDTGEMGKITDYKPASMPT